MLILVKNTESESVCMILPHMLSIFRSNEWRFFATWVSTPFAVNFTIFSPHFGTVSNRVSNFRIQEAI